VFLRQNTVRDERREYQDEAWGNRAESGRQMTEDHAAAWQQRGDVEQRRQKQNRAHDGIDERRPLSPRPRGRFTPRETERSTQAEDAPDNAEADDRPLVPRFVAARDVGARAKRQP